jgi:hypothetical protein
MNGPVHVTDLAFTLHRELGVNVACLTHLVIFQSNRFDRKSPSVFGISRKSRCRAADFVLLAQPFVSAISNILLFPPL